MSPAGVLAGDHFAIYSIFSRLYLEARVGIEPTHKGFADLSLTTWVPLLEQVILIQVGMEKPVTRVSFG
jgi:hypothetical protein